MNILRLLCLILFLSVSFSGEGSGPPRRVVHPPVPPRQVERQMPFKPDSQLTHLFNYWITRYLVPSANSSAGTASNPLVPVPGSTRKVASIATFGEGPLDPQSEIRSASFAPTGPTQGFSHLVATTPLGKYLPPALLKVFDDPLFMSEVMKMTENQSKLTHYQMTAGIATLVLLLLTIFLSWRRGFLTKILIKMAMAVVLLAAHAAIFYHYFPQLGKILGQAIMTAILTVLKNGA